MKLVLCTECHDVYKLAQGETRSCACGKTSGRYLNSTDAEYSGETAVPMGFGNTSLVKAFQNQPESGDGKRFTAFVIPKECPTMRRV